MASLGTRAGVLVSGLGEGAAIGQGIVGSLGAGFKSGRVVGLLALDFIDVTVGGGSGFSEAAFLLGPQLEIAIVRSDDQRVELLAHAGLGLGHVFVHQSDVLGSSTAGSNLYIGYQLGPGARFWAHRQLAVQALTGFAGEALVVLGSSDNTGNVSAHGVFASLGVLSVF